MGRLIREIPDGHFGEDFLEGADDDAEGFVAQPAKGHPNDNQTVVGDVLAAELEVLQVVQVSVRLVAQIRAIRRDHIVHRVGEAEVGSCVVDDHAIARVKGAEAGRGLDRVGTERIRRARQPARGPDGIECFLDHVFREKNAVVRVGQAGGRFEDRGGDLDRVDFLDLGIKGIGPGRSAGTEAHGRHARGLAAEKQHRRVGEGLLIRLQDRIGARNADVIDVYRAPTARVFDHGNSRERPFVVVGHRLADSELLVLDIAGGYADAADHERDNEQRDDHQGGALPGRELRVHSQHHDAEQKRCPGQRGQRQRDPEQRNQHEPAEERADDRAKRVEGVDLAHVAPEPAD